jgi:hypothetical protein
MNERGGKGASFGANARVYRGSLRRANFASPARDAGKHTLHTEERSVHLMWSRLNLPSSTPDSLSGQPSMRERAVEAAFDSPLTVSYGLGPGQDIASCRMFDLPSKPPSTLEPSGPPSLTLPPVFLPPAAAAALSP